MTDLTTAKPQKEMAAPIRSAESRPFWEAAQEGRFLLKKCDDCGLVFWYPRALCPDCWSSQTSWMASSGRGSVYTYTIMRRVKVPYVVAYVHLDDGPTMLTNLKTDDFDSIRVGMRVEVTFAQAVDGSKIPVFKPELAAA
jgi:uncharacterized OB-fold protein